MSDPGNTPPDVPLPIQPPLERRSGCMTFCMVIIGIVLLLPGFCAVIFGAMSLTAPHFDSGFTPFIVVGLLVGFGGIMLIRAAVRGRQP